MELIDYLTKRLDWGDSVWDYKTDDGYRLTTWVDNVRFSSSNEKLCMFIDIEEKGRKKNKKGYYHGDIESRIEFEYVIEDLIEKIKEAKAEKEKRKAKRKT